MSDKDNKVVDALIPVESNLPAEGMRYFRDLKETDDPIIPLPHDSMMDLQYPQFFEARCAICSSPYRNLAEHVFLESGKKSQTVIKFFERHYNAKLNWSQVSTHMDNHCDFKKLVTSGLKNYEQREELIAPWIFRENQLALTALMVELDDIRGMDCSKSNELKLKRAAMVEKLIGKIMDLTEKRNNQGVFAFNIFDILWDLHEKFNSSYDKQLVREQMKSLRDQLKQDN